MKSLRETATNVRVVGVAAAIERAPREEETDALLL